MNNVASAAYYQYTNTITYIDKMILLLQLCSHLWPQRQHLREDFDGRDHPPLVVALVAGQLALQAVAAAVLADVPIRA